MLGEVINELKGFMVVLILFLLAFTTSDAIIKSYHVAKAKAVAKKAAEAAGTAGSTGLLELDDVEDHDLSPASFGRSFGTNYLIMFGEFPEDPFQQETVIETILFMVVTLIIPLILLNLVIAIMSDTYERVITSSRESDNHQLCSIICQFENFYFWRREQGKEKPMHLFWYEYSTDNAYEWLS